MWLVPGVGNTTVHALPSSPQGLSTPRCSIALSGAKWPCLHPHHVGVATNVNPLFFVLCVCVCDVFACGLSGRPTEIPESDMFVCENRYNEADKEIRRHKGLKVTKINHH